MDNEKKIKEILNGMEYLKKRIDWLCRVLWFRLNEENYFFGSSRLKQETLLNEGRDLILKDQKNENL